MPERLADPELHKLERRVRKLEDRLDLVDHMNTKLIEKIIEIAMELQKLRGR